MARLMYNRDDHSYGHGFVYHRRGNIMLFVVFLLATLFTATMSFVALMALNRDVLNKDRQVSPLEVFIEELIDTVSHRITSTAVDEFDSSATFPCSPSSSPSLVRLPYAALAGVGVGDCEEEIIDGTPTFVGDGLVDMPDELSQWALIPGVHPMVASLEPSLDPTGRLEYFSTTDTFRFLDGGSDFQGSDVIAHTGPQGLEYHPLFPASRPMRIRPLEAEFPTYDYDQIDYVRELPGGPRDADGDGVVDSILAGLTLLADGEPDFYVTTTRYPDGVAEHAVPTGGDARGDCGIVIGGWNSPSGAPSWTDDSGNPVRTPLPSDDRNCDEELSPGEQYPLPLRRLFAEQLADPSSAGSESYDSDLFLALRILPNTGKVDINGYWTLVDQLLGMDRGTNPRPLSTHLHQRPYVKETASWFEFLPPRVLTDVFPLGRDIMDSQDLQSMLYDHMTANSGNLQWYPIGDEPGEGGVYDRDFFTRWMNPALWNDPADTTGTRSIDYDVRHLLTVASSADSLFRNGFYVEGTTPFQLTNGLSDLPKYPAHDPLDPAGSFRSASTPMPIQYEVDMDQGISTLPQNSLLGKLQFRIHSFTNVNSVTARERGTLQDYFMLMLRNVSAQGWNDAYRFDLAAQLTANFIDFADADNKPTKVSSQGVGGQDFYGLEQQPYLSEVYFEQLNSGNDPVLAVELTNPNPDEIDLANTQEGQYGIHYVHSNGTRYELLSAFTTDPTNVLDESEIVYVANDNISLLGGGPPSGRSSNSFSDELIKEVVANDLGSGQPGSKKIQLVRMVDTAIVIVDEIEFPVAYRMGEAIMRDNEGAGGWRVPVPVTVSITQHTLGRMNRVENDEAFRGIAPVHALTDDSGSLEVAYPTTGSLLLLMQYANTDTLSTLKRPWTQPLNTYRNQVDNGHMPVFDQSQVAQRNWNQGRTGLGGAQPLDGSVQLNIPWGLLIYDYFTTVPFAHKFDPTRTPPPITPFDPNTPGSARQFATALKQHQPTVRGSGLWVEGQINPNVATAKALAGIPYLKPGQLPIYREQSNLFDTAGGGGGSFGGGGTAADPAGTWFKLTDPQGLGHRPMAKDPNANLYVTFQFTRDQNGNPIEMLGLERAQSIVAYRELREIAAPGGEYTTGSYNVLDTTVNSQRLRADLSHVQGGSPTLAAFTQRHTAGFTCVGELANVRNPNAYYDTGYDPSGTARFSMDNGQAYVYPQNKNYLFAIAPMVAMFDSWVTVKSNNFTVYGVLRGYGMKKEVDNRAMRFQFIVDRTSTLLNSDPNAAPDMVYKHVGPLYP